MEGGGGNALAREERRQLGFRNKVAPGAGGRSRCREWAEVRRGGPVRPVFFTRASFYALKVHASAVCV